MKSNYFIPVLLLLAAVACQKEPLYRPQPEAESGVRDAGTISGMMRIEVSDELAGKLLASMDSNGNIVETKAAGFGIEGIKSVRTTFLIGGRFEERQRKAGLHRWFDVEYDEECMAATKASSTLGSIPGVSIIEPVYAVREQSVEMNDPDYARYQWHYNNTGQFGFRKGVDIKLQQAWDAYGIFGNSDVIVAVTDGGIDYRHPDLAGNMWVNEAEKNGVPGRDDDGNGYVDDVYGYNFVANSADVSAHEHGTHVAGTVAAVNNNGIGVCGVAGGRYPEKGVRMMSCQMLDPRYENRGANIPRLFQYAAENGAVISQNSWGYEVPQTVMPEADKKAIDYFIDNAGMDEHGNQVGPMKGGLVVFAAGNSSVELDYPPAYERVIAVASIGPKGLAASYTNYGDWVDVCAPGGDIDRYQTYDAGVYSTVPSSQYASMQGTSMACPHVSGLAALVLSASGAVGYTCNDLFETIVKATDPSIYEYNPSMTGKLGSGMIDATLALSSLNTEAPQKLSYLEVEAVSNTLYFTADVPSDDGGESKAFFYNLYYSSSPFTDLSDAEKVKYSISEAEDAGDGHKRFALKGLEFNTTYYYAVSAGDFAGNESAATSVAQTTTGGNNAPAVTPDSDEPILVESWNVVTRTFSLSDPDGHEAFMVLDDNGLNGLSFTVEKNVGTLTISGPYSPAGKHTCHIVAEDEYGMQMRYPVNYEVLVNNPPQLVKEMKDITINGVKSKVSVNISEFFADPDGESLSIIPSISDRNVVSFSYTGDVITFTAKNLGSTPVRVTASDAKGESVESRFTIYVRDSARPVDTYPNPASDIVNVRTGDTVRGDVTVYSATGASVYSQKNVTIGLDSPLAIDISQAAPGVYSIVITCEGGQVIRSSFTKI